MSKLEIDQGIVTPSVVGIDPFWCKTRIVTLSVVGIYPRDGLGTKTKGGQINYMYMNMKHCP